MTQVGGHVLFRTLSLILACHEGPRPAGPFEVGTAIVAVRTENVLVVGADSKTTRLETPDISTSTCKLQEVAGVFFAVAGLRRSADGDFDVPLLAARACQIPGSLGSKVEAFEQALQGPLTAALLHIRATQPDYFHGREGRRAPFVEVGFFSNEGGRPRLLIRDFKARETGHGPLSIEAGGDELSSPGIAVMGEAREMSRYVEANPIVHGMNPVDLARALLDRASTAHPETVGPPLDLVELDGQRARWVDRKPECAP